SQPDRPHLRLVSGGSPARSGESQAPGSEPAARSSEGPPAELPTDVQLAGRWGGSPEAARFRVARPNLPRMRGRSGKIRVAGPQEALQQPPSARSSDSDRPMIARSPDGTADVANQGETAAETAKSPPKKRLGTTGRRPKKRNAAAERMRADLRNERFT